MNERTEDKNLSQEKRMNERTYVRTYGRTKEKPEFLVSVFNVTKDKSERRRNRKDKRLFMLEARTLEIQTDQRLLKVRKQFIIYLISK